MNLKNLPLEEIRGYIQSERRKGRSMREIVKEVVDTRNDCIILSHDPQIAEQQTIEALTKKR
jgi:hypothetical protein